MIIVNNTALLILYIYVLTASIRKKKMVTMWGDECVSLIVLQSFHYICILNHHIIHQSNTCNFDFLIISQ